MNVLKTCLACSCVATLWGCFVEGQEPVALLQLKLPLEVQACQPQSDGLYSLEDCGAFIALKLFLNDSCTADALGTTSQFSFELPGNSEGRVEVKAWRLESGQPVAYAASTPFTLSSGGSDLTIDLQKTETIPQPLGELPPIGFHSLQPIDTALQLRLPALLPEDPLLLPKDRAFKLDLRSETGESLLQSAEFWPSDAPQWPR